MLNEKQIIPKSKLLLGHNNNVALNINSSTPYKLSLVEMNVDYSIGVDDYSNKGSSKILLREDIMPDVDKVKNILNSFGIPLTCNALDLDLNNKNVSKISKTGLEVNLNYEAGLSVHSNYINDDYYIGPDYNRPLGNGYFLKVYGLSRKNPYFNNTGYNILYKELDVYDIRESYMKKIPKIKKIFKPVIDITKIFEDHGFINKKPQKEFIYKSDNLKSNWYIFYKTDKISFGAPFKEVLSIVYDNNGEYIWTEKDTYWDGDDFK